VNASNKIDRVSHPAIGSATPLRAARVPTNAIVRQLPPAITVAELDQLKPRDGTGQALLVTALSRVRRGGKEAGWTGGGCFRRPARRPTPFRALGERRPVTGRKFHGG